nr:hypothetical protein [Tanacetum cinerariifolium]
VKQYQEKEKIESKPDKNGKRGEAGKSQKQLQWIEEEKLKKTQNEGPEMQTHASFNKERRKEGQFCNLMKVSSKRLILPRDCGCSKRNVKDKILVPKPPKNCARCTRYGYLVDGPNCQGCALLRQELEENLVTHSPDFQNSSEPSNASTNVVNAPREPYVVNSLLEEFADELALISYPLDYDDNCACV